ncbi:MAG: hypothetical protein IJS40_01315 [Synergistaceae bacterium]|nr:hypothetical protein [Synergistaceae bacterium]
MKLKIKIRKGETLAESVMALAIFGVLMLGITDFMAGQTNYIARTHYRDEIIYQAQALTANNVFSALDDTNFSAEDSGLSDTIKELETKASFDWEGKENYKKVLTIKNGTEEMSFTLPTVYK